MPAKWGAERMKRTPKRGCKDYASLRHTYLPLLAEAVNTACYNFTRVRSAQASKQILLIASVGHKPILSYIRPFGCHVTILNTLSPLGKFDGKSDEGFLVGYSVNSKAFRGIGHRWMFDLDYLTDSMNYIPVSLQNQANPAGSKEVIDIMATEEDADLNVNTGNTEAISPSADHEEEASYDDDGNISDFTIYQMRGKSQSLEDGSWVEANARDKLLQFKLQQVWFLVDFTQWCKVIDKNKGFEHDEVFCTLARIEAIRGLVLTTPVFVDPDNPTKVYKVSKLCMDCTKPLELGYALYLSTFLRSTSQAEHRRHLHLSRQIYDRFASVLTASRPDIIYHQGQTQTLGLWYPRESPFDLEAFSDSDYGGSNLDRKSTTGGCQCLGQED
ncbi:hypothetical protein Tco_0355122 [Tanacetum coccineum]